MKKILPIALAVLLLAACGDKHTVTFCGTLENGAGKVIYLEELTPEGALFIDSITLDGKGCFKYKYDMPYKTFYNLHASQYDYVVLLPDYGEKVEVEGCYDSLSMTYKIKGAGDSQLLWQLQSYTNDGINVLRHLGATDAANKQLLAEGKMTEAEYDAAHQQTDSVYLATYYEQQAYVMDFIEQHAGSLATIIALYKPFNVSMPLVRPEEHFEYYDLVLQGLEEGMPDNPHTLNFKNTVEHLRYQYVMQQE